MTAMVLWCLSCMHEGDSSEMETVMERPQKKLPTCAWLIFCMNERLCPEGVHPGGLCP